MDIHSFQMKGRSNHQRKGNHFVFQLPQIIHLSKAHPNLSYCPFIVQLHPNLFIHCALLLGLSTVQLPQTIYTTFIHSTVPFGSSNSPKIHLMSHSLVGFMSVIFLVFNSPMELQWRASVGRF